MTHIRYTTPIGCRTDCLTGKCDTLAGSWGFLPADPSRGLRRGLRPSDHRAMKNAPLRGASPPDTLCCRTSRTAQRTPALFWEIHPSSGDPAMHPDRGASFTTFHNELRVFYKLKGVTPVDTRHNIWLLYRATDYGNLGLWMRYLLTWKKRGAESVLRDRLGSS